MTILTSMFEDNTMISPTPFDASLYEEDWRMLVLIALGTFVFGALVFLVRHIVSNRIAPVKEHLGLNYLAVLGFLAVAMGVIFSLSASIAAIDNEPTRNAALAHFGIMSADQDSFTLPGSVNKITRLDNVLAKPEGSQDYSTYKHVVIFRNDDGTYSAEYIKNVK